MKSREGISLEVNVVLNALNHSIDCYFIFTILKRFNMWFVCTVWVCLCLVRWGQVSACCVEDERERVGFLSTEFPSVCVQGLPSDSTVMRIIVPFFHLSFEKKCHRSFVVNWVLYIVKLVAQVDSITSLSVFFLRDKAIIDMFWSSHALTDTVIFVFAGCKDAVRDKDSVVLSACFLFAWGRPRMTRHKNATHRERKAKVFGWKYKSCKKRFVLLFSIFQCFYVSVSVHW